MKTRHFAIAFIALIMGCDTQQPPESPPRPALVMVVGDKTEANSMTLVGEVRPRYESSQGFRINGKIINRIVDVGATVKKGQIIAKLDPADTHLSAAAALANVRAAEASRALAAAEYDRYQQLFAKRFISASALDLKQAELKNANAKLAQAKAQADVAQNQGRYTDLTADRDGVVTMISAEPGQVVQPGEAVAKIADTNAIEVLVAVPELRITSVKLNMTVGVKLWADGQKDYSGTVREISPAADTNTRAFNARIAVSDFDADFKLGMTARVKFLASDGFDSTGFLIPSTALTEINGKKTVWVIGADNKAQTREVNAGEFTEQGVLIHSGLEAGEKIAVVGVHTLVQGQLVKPVTEPMP